MTLEHLAGRLTLTLTHDGAAVTHCHSEFSRPPLAARLLAGAAPADAAARLAPLFAVCRRAHALAADLAAQVLHGPAAPRPEALAELEAEARQDILRRVALDWPLACGDSPDADFVAAVRAQPAALGQALQDYVLGEPCADWLARGYHGWLAWARQRHTQYAWRLADLMAESCGGMPLLSFPSEGELAVLGRDLLDDDQFAQTPSWVGSPVETGPLARQANWVASLFAAEYWPAARMLARLIELVRLSQGSAGYQARAVALDPQRAVAVVDTARGLLLHAVAVDAHGQVADWRILPPTAWNFHPEGAWAAALDRVLPEQAEAAARRAALWLDPCVEYQLMIKDSRQYA